MELFYHLLHKVFLTFYAVDGMRRIQQHARFIRNEQRVYNVFMHDGLQFVGFSVFLLRVAISLFLATGSFYHICV